jgi:uncharacterized SAM-binding protein YcdF (DUF218 family)
MGRLFTGKPRISSILLITIGLILLISIIPLRLIITLHQVPKPQAILVLGGDFKRISYAAQLAQEHIDLDIWVSDYPYNYQINSRLLAQAEIAPERIHYDFHATDTVTNFTCTVGEFVERDIRHLYLITSDYHMRRAKIIATLVLGSQGIAVTPIAVPVQGFPHESLVRILRDASRSIFWMITGKTGASLNPRLRASKLF